jgi:hypothetical protein
MAKKVQKADELVVDNSILSATAKCHTYAYVRYALGLNVKGEALALEAGNAIHLGMELWMKGGSAKAATAAMAEQYEEVVERYLQAAELDQLPEKEKRFAPERVVGIFYAHLMKLEERFPFKVIKAAIEGPVSAPFPSTLDKPVRYVARLDAIVRRWESGGKWSFDHKSTRRITDWWQDKQKVSSQWSGQVWLGQQTGVEDLEGVIIHAIELPEPHTSDKKCREHGVPYTECSIRHATYDYVYVTRSPAELEGWLTSAKALVHDYANLVALAKDEDIGAVTEVSMQGRFNEGCIFCSMKEWCRMGRNTRAPVVRATFRHEVWNPLALKVEES